jgi:hypothetical protein
MSSLPSEEQLRRADTAVSTLGRATRRSTREGLDLVTLGGGDDAITLIGHKEAVASLVDGIEAARAALPVLLETVRWLQKEREARETRDAAESASGTTPAARKAAADLQDVPIALVAPFRPNEQSLESAKTDPLAALAVQVAKAMQPDASELDRARLIAMAFAATRGDMEAFWAARAQRSLKKAKTKAESAG